MRGGNEIGRILERGGVERWRLGEERVESSVIEPDGRRGNGEEEGKESREGERRRRRDERMKDEKGLGEERNERERKEGK